MRLFSLFAVSALALMLCACGSMQDSLHFDLGGQPTYYKDTTVSRSRPQVAVHPVTPPNRELTALMVPLRVSQEVVGAKDLGREISRQLWQTWLGEQIFPIIEFAENAPPYRADLAQYLGTARRAELAIGGYITRYYNGGAVGKSSLGVTLEIWDLATGNLLWVVSHYAEIDPTGYNDYILFNTRKRVPADPMWLVIQTVARDLAYVVKSWSDPFFLEDQEGEGTSEPSAFGSGPGGQAAF